MNCKRCNRPLKDPLSIKNGIGPVCNEQPVEQIITQLSDLPFAGDIVCWRGADGVRHFNVPQVKVLHSPSGMEWGYGGSGPADFALNILLMFTDTATAERLHQPFKWEYVAKLPEEGGIIEAEKVRAFIASTGKEV